MRNLAILLLTATSLTACGGGDTQSASAIVPTVATGAATSSGSSSSTDVYAQFVTPTAARTFSGIGATHTFKYQTDERGILGSAGQQASSYAGNASTVRDSKISFSYDPRDAIFTLRVTDPLSGTQVQTRFQDPASRTNYGGAVEPQWGNVNFATGADFGNASAFAANASVRFVEAGDGDPIAPYRRSGSGSASLGTPFTPPDGTPGSSIQATTLFYEVPGTSTRYVSLAGFVRNDLAWTEQTPTATPANPSPVPYKVAQWNLSRGAFAYGIQTDNAAVPRTGSGTYTGTMLATMVFNPTLDQASNLPSYFQWISGTSSTTVNFQSNAVTVSLNGVVSRPHFDRYTSTQAVTLAAGTAFTASATGTIDLVRTGGFTGQFQSAGFGSGATATPVNIAGSNLDGAFFGPAGEEVGGGFRIVGGTPDERIDVMGAFKGRKP
jgi:hypothetical protein